MEHEDKSRGFLNYYLDRKLTATEKKNTAWIKIGFCILLYVVTLYIESQSQSIKNINGLFAQVQVMISVFMVISVIKMGYIAAVAVNGAGSLLAAAAVIRGNDLTILPGVIIPICTIITITIISLVGRRLNRRVAEVIIQKEEITSLCKELSATEEKLSHQNKKLLEFNSAMRENEEKLNFMAYFDTLTGLPNRKMIINQLEFMINLSSEYKMRFAVVFIDLDNFKRINDSMGHYIGDLMLQAAVLRLKVLIRSGDILGRLGGDEFALIIRQDMMNEEILEYVETLRLSLMNPFIIENTELNISASFGVSIFPQDGKDSTELLKCADTAMYKAKDHGKNLIQFFSKEMKDEFLKKNKLLQSIRNHEILLMFQTQYSSQGKELRGFETLVRWKSADLGQVNPEDFIPIAEETRFIIPLGEWILRTACKKFRKIQDQYGKQYILSVNMSAVQIMEPTFVHMVKNVLEETGLEAKNLEIEITESVFISSMEYVVKVFNELKEIGIQVSLDDFGTGYSSLNYIKHLPIDTLKIDKSFVKDIGCTDSRKQIIGSIISLVHQMDIEVIAEGVENFVQLEYLKTHGCDYIQGYIWGKPLFEEELDYLLSEQKQLVP